MRSDKVVLLFIHGFPLDSGLWAPQLEGLRGSVPMLAPDLRGFGTDKRPVPAVMCMDDHAQDLRSLLDASGIDRVVLCGLSMGGYVAMAFLERWPERVAGLVLANTRSTADDEAGRAAREESARNALEKGMAVMARGMVPKLFTERTRRDRPELVGTVETMIARQSPEATAASARGMALRPDRSELLKRTRIPTLVITGDADELMPLPTSQAMADAVPDSTLVVLPGTAHLSNLEDPTAFNSAIARFMNVQTVQ